jgi:hypothetical protein
MKILNTFSAEKYLLLKVWSPANWSTILNKFAQVAGKDIEYYEKTKLTPLAWNTNGTSAQTNVAGLETSYHTDLQKLLNEKTSHRHNLIKPCLVETMRPRSEPKERWVKYDFQTA